MTSSTLMTLLMILMMVSLITILMICPVFRRLQCLKGLRDKTECNCQTCLDSNRLHWPENILKDNKYKEILIQLWKEIHHGCVTNRYIQGEDIIFMAFLDTLVFDEKTMLFTPASIEKFRNEITSCLPIYYAYFLPESLAILGVEPREQNVVVTVVNSMNPSLFLAQLKNCPHKLIRKIHSFAKKINNLDDHCKANKVLAHYIMKYINSDLFFNDSDVSIGFDKPDNKHAGITVWDVDVFKKDQLEMLFRVIKDSNRNNKIRVSKKLRDKPLPFSITQRWIFTTDLFDKWN